MINLDAIRKIAYQEFETSRKIITEQRGKQLTHNLLVIRGHDLSDEWFFDRIMIMQFDERRLKVLKMIGNDYGGRGVKVIAVMLNSEVWESLQRQGERIEPRFAANRRESLMVQVMTIDLHQMFISCEFTRDKKGVPQFKEIRYVDKGLKSIILGGFINEYALAYLAYKEKMRTHH